MIDETTFIKWKQRKSYQNNQNQIYDLKIPSSANGFITFKKGQYNVQLPKEIGTCTLSFPDSTVHLKGQKKGILKPLDNIKLMCTSCIVDLTEGIYNLPLKIETETLIIAGANYTQDITDMYTVNQENELYKRFIQKMLESKETISIQNSFLNLGTNPLNITCKNFYLENTKIIIPYNSAKIECNTLSTKNSLLDVQREKLTLYADVAHLKDTIISSAKPSEIDITETLLKGSSLIETKSNKTNIK